MSSAGSRSDSGSRQWTHSSRNRDGHDGHTESVPPSIPSAPVLRGARSQSALAPSRACSDGRRPPGRCPERPKPTHARGGPGPAHDRRHGVLLDLDGGADLFELLLPLLSLPTRHLLLDRLWGPLPPPLCPPPPPP